MNIRFIILKAGNGNDEGKLWHHERFEIVFASHNIGNGKYSGAEFFSYEDANKCIEELKKSFPGEHYRLAAVWD